MRRDEDIAPYTIARLKSKTGRWQSTAFYVTMVEDKITRSDRMTAIFSSMQNDRDPGKAPLLDRVFDAETQARLRHTLAFMEPFTSMAQLEPRKTEFAAVEAMFSTWGQPVLTEEQIRVYFPNLKYIFYGAGSVQHFARPFMRCGVRIFCAADANSIPVIEYCLAQILLANKGFYQSSYLYSRGDWEGAKAHFSAHSGNYGDRIGIIGAGKIGRGVIEALAPYRLKIMVFDPFLPQTEAGKLGVTLCGLDEMFGACAVISNHLANNAQTQDMLNYSHFSKMRPYATFLNTGRRAQVVEADLARALEEVPTRTAVLDVTWPEPCEPGHPFFGKSNILLTPHIAGSSGDEVARMGEFMADEWEAVRDGKTLRYEVTAEMLETMA
jgi:phosphoglycerate dehydrogenase-like enzyme